MAAKEYTMMGVIALLAGLIGGAISSQMLVDESSSYETAVGSVSSWPFILT